MTGDLTEEEHITNECPGRARWACGEAGLHPTTHPARFGREPVLLMGEILTHTHRPASHSPAVSDPANSYIGLGP